MTFLDRAASLEERLQRGHHVSSDEHVDAPQRFEDRFVLHTRRPWGERYLDGRLYLHVHVAAGIDRFDGGKTGYWCVGFYHPLKGRKGAGEDTGVSRSAGVEKDAGEMRHRRMQQAVLVDAVKVTRPREIGPAGMRVRPPHRAGGLHETTTPHP